MNPDCLRINPGFAMSRCPAGMDFAHVHRLAREGAGMRREDGNLFMENDIHVDTDA